VANERRNKDADGPNEDEGRRSAGSRGRRRASDDGSGGNGGADESQELRGSPEMDVAVISGRTFANKSITYYNIDGLAMFEGDIVLGAVDEIRRQTDAVRDALASGAPIAFGVGITGAQFRWPNCQMPYEIDPALPNQQRVTDAIAHWEANTAFRFPLRTAANAAQYPNFVRFTNAGGCWSFLGMRGGQQDISLDVGCTTGNTIHEIGHAVGLWHEQSREDRDLFVRINWQNIQAGMSAQFNQHITDGDDLGAYDYGSIMHYPRTAFSANGQETITPLTPNAQIGQRTGLSPGDIAAVRALYPGCVIKQPILDGPFKKIRDEAVPFKKIRDDMVVKPFRDPKPILDPKLPRDVGPVKPLRDPGPIKRLDPITPVFPEIRPGTLGLQPFTMATTHHASLGGAGEAEAAGQAQATAYLATLERQLLDLEAAIDQARSTASQATAEMAHLEEARDSLAAAYAQALSDLGLNQ
jgi:Astacin (Peptidase family M12A)